MRYLVLFSLFFVSACGFSPVYGTKAKTNTENIASKLNQVSIAIIPDREGQYLRNALIDRFYTKGIPASSRYALRINPITERTYNFDITVESEATRRQLKLNTQMKLIDTQTKDIVLTRTLLSIASYNVLQSEFSTIVTEQSAREDALNDLARQIERQLILYLKK